jgi:hypothetical protein
MAEPNSRRLLKDGTEFELGMHVPVRLLEMQFGHV